MRGRPACELLRQSAPLIAVAALLVVAPVAAGSPQPDRAPSTPATLAPDPVPGTKVPGTSSTAPARVPTPASSRRVYVAPTPAKPVTHATVKHAAVKPAHRRASPARPSRYVLPRIAFPALIAADPVRVPGDLDAILAGLALLLAAVTAGSGARVIAVWNRRARAA
jgi:hypothetical protein